MFDLLSEGGRPEMEVIGNSAQDKFVDALNGDGTLFDRSAEEC